MEEQRIIQVSEATETLLDLMKRFDESVKALNQFCEKEFNKDGRWSMESFDLYSTLREHYDAVLGEQIINTLYLTETAMI